MDGRSDLYSFGCVLYELLAGRPPFVAEIPIAVMRMHLEERPVPMRNIRSDLPNGLPELVDRLLAKDRDARPPDAGYVLRSLFAISDNLAGSATPEHEADRRTFLAGGADDTARGAWPTPPADPAPETYRATLVADDPPQWPGQGPRPEDKGKRRASGGPDGWPTARPRRRRRRWTGVLSSLLTFAIVAGVADYVWNKTHQTLKVTAATVSVANPGKIGCNSTVDVVGLIFTNGNGGPITYQWTKDGENLPTGTVTAASGQQQVRVDLQWHLRGKGTHHAVAIFQVFTPNVISPSPPPSPTSAPHERHRLRPAGRAGPGRPARRPRRPDRRPGPRARPAARRARPRSPTPAVTVPPSCWPERAPPWSAAGGPRGPAPG